MSQEKGVVGKTQASTEQGKLSMFPKPSPLWNLIVSPKSEQTLTE